MEETAPSSLPAQEGLPLLVQDGVSLAIYTDSVKEGWAIQWKCSTNLEQLNILLMKLKQLVTSFQHRNSIDVNHLPQLVSVLVIQLLGITLAPALQIQTPPSHQDSH